MITVAVIGADGAGKSTVCRKIEESLDLPIKYIYMGVNLEASKLMLPTTRLVLELKRLRGRRPDAVLPEPSSEQRVSKSLLKKVKAYFRMAFWISEEWFRQFAIWYYQLQGKIVIFDRHFFADYFAYDIIDNGQPRPLPNRVHGYMLKHIYPKPDLFIMLDAPVEVLFARKGEGTLEFLEDRRQQYLMLKDHVRHFETVDASQPQDAVVMQVSEIIQKYYHAQKRSV